MTLQHTVVLTVDVAELDHLPDVVSQLTTVATGHALAGRDTKVRVDCYTVEDAETDVET